MNRIVPPNKIVPVNKIVRFRPRVCHCRGLPYKIVLYLLVYLLPVYLPVYLRASFLINYQYIYIFIISNASSSLNCQFLPLSSKPYSAAPSTKPCEKYTCSYTTEINFLQQLQDLPQLQDPQQLHDLWQLQYLHFNNA